LKERKNIRIPIQNGEEEEENLLDNENGQEMKETINNGTFFGRMYA
jgi:hypothetical protein